MQRLCTYILFIHFLNRWSLPVFQHFMEIFIARFCGLILHLLFLQTVEKGVFHFFHFTCFK